MIEYCRLTIDYLRSAFGGSIYKKTYQKNDGAERFLHSSIVIFFVPARPGWES